MNKQGNEVREVKQKIDKTNHALEETNTSLLMVALGTCLFLFVSTWFSKSIGIPAGFGIVINGVMPCLFLFIMFGVWVQVFRLRRQKKRLKKELGKLLTEKL
ncbi:hypothetical protein [Bacillus thuringiensis]|uniref:hypothetical protein n=1 Tax=Bacillus thuringiensis TaxID=1428 RepID=UPI000BFE24BA|nr:hypothetical protein [Bacillus thuringiensis]PGT89792.1 hypothetical protein COD17_08560 [Bacillus thuringiensis]